MFNHKHTISTVMVSAAAAAAIVAATVGSAEASDSIHLKYTRHYSFDNPAGTLCDFHYHGEADIRVNVTRFLDDTGNVVRLEAQIELRVLHQNADTGFALTETDHWAEHWDIQAGQVDLTGQFWALRDPDGRPVLVGAGHETLDLNTGETVGTPNAQTGRFAQIVCRSLGGNPVI